jgi:alkylation response protein AidB-like acyl-CoA dehydrogenase
MEFEFSSEHRMIRETMRKVAEKEFTKHIQESEEKETFPRELITTLGREGFLCMGLPEEYGGANADNISQCIQAEEFARVNLGFSVAIGVDCGASTSVICRFGTEEQKRRFVIPVARGEKVTCLGQTEADAGSDRSLMKTTARREGDEYVINGSKMYISNFSIADFVTVEAFVDRSLGLRGIGLFIVETGTPGFARGQKLSKCGVRSCESGELIFDECRIPAENVIGEETEGWGKAVDVLTAGKVQTAARALGLAGASFEATVKYSKERVQFGKPIGQHQALTVKIAQMATEIEAARLLVYQAAWLLDQGKLPIKEAAMAKLYACEMASRVTSEAVHIHGAYGYMKEPPVERYFRDGRYLTITKGPTEIQQLIIGGQLGLFGEVGTIKY